MNNIWDKLLKLFRKENDTVVVREKTPYLDTLQMSVEGYRDFLERDIYNDAQRKYHNERYLNSIVRYATKLKEVRV